MSWDQAESLARARQNWWNDFPFPEGLWREREVIDPEWKGIEFPSIFTANPEQS
jgi:hypothetical protein